MFIYIYYPFLTKLYFTVIIDSNFKIYWQASHIAKIFRLGKSARKVFGKYLSKHRRLLRVKDVTRSRNCNHFIFTTEEVLTIIHRIRHERQHRNVQFELWFNNIVNGRQSLYARNVVNFKRLSENPFQEKGFSAICINVNPNGTVTTTAASARNSGSEQADLEYNEKSGAPSSVPMQEEDESVDDAEITSKPTEPETNASTFYSNPPSCASVYSEMTPSPYPEDSELENFNKTFLFCLPDYIRRLQEKFDRRNVSPEIPTRPDQSEPSESNGLFNRQSRQSPPPEQYVNQQPSQPSTTPPPVASSPQSTTSFTDPAERIEPTQENDTSQNELDPFHLDLNEPKTFMLSDPIFKTEYKFYAMKVNWITELRSFDIHPFYKTDNDGTYMYFPVKKH